MQLLRFIPSKHYFIAIFIIGSALFATFSAVIYHQYSNAQRTNQWALHYYESLRLTRRVLVDLLDMETGVRGYIIAKDNKFLEPYNEALPNLEDNIRQLRDSVSNSQISSAKMDVFLNEALKFQDLLNSQIAEVKNNSSFHLANEMLSEQKDEMDRLRKSITVFTDEGLAGLKKELEIARKKDAEFFYLIVIGTILAIGAMLLATIVIISLSARSKKAELAAYEGEKRFRMVMTGVNDGLYDYDRVNKTIYYSPTYKSMLGYTDEEHPDNKQIFRDLLHPDDVERTFDTYRLYKQRHIPIYNNIFRLLHKDGSWRWIMSRGVGIWDKEGKLIQLIGTHTDITEQKNREEDLKQLNSDLETFAYIASHDLRSPLVNLKGFASEMEYALKEAKPILKKAEYRLDDKDKEILVRSLEKDIPEALHFIKQSVDKMDTLTNAVLDLSRIGKREFRFEKIEPEALVERCLGALAYEINQKNVEITYGSLPPIITDALALEQIFSNLIDNAVKYMVAGKQGKISISAQQYEKDIVFTISDNGRGISEADRHKVFEIFRRARNTGDARGIGMGLAYVKATLRKLGGAISFESTIDVGTMFHFRLPKIPSNLRVHSEREN